MPDSAPPERLSRGSTFDPATMTVGLFVPCYIDQLYPRVGMATLELLERLGLTVVFPDDQTCCGQPMNNVGLHDQAAKLALRYADIFRPFDAIVCPSGSCVSMVRKHYSHLFDQPSATLADSMRAVTSRTYELCEFLHDVLKLDRLPDAIRPASFPYRVGLHQACHGVRELGLAVGSERRIAGADKVRTFLTSIDDMTLVDLDRRDECCGFGGTFAVSEEAVSCMMGTDRISDHQKHGAEIIASADMSCLMHMDGLIRRQKRPMTVMHVAEILAGYQPEPRPQSRAM